MHPKLCLRGPGVGLIIIHFIVICAGVYSISLDDREAVGYFQGPALWVSAIGFYKFSFKLEALRVSLGA